MSAASEFKLQVIDDLKVYYGINEAVAENGHDEAITLYHRLCTMTNFNELTNVNRQVLFALIIVICNYLDCKDTSR